MYGYGQREVYLTLNGNKVKGRQVVLPMPPTENNRHQPIVRRGHPVLINTTAYNSWLNAARNALMKGKLPKLDGDVSVLVMVVFPDERRRDAQNREKALFDAFTQSGCVYEDDCKIKLHATMKQTIKNESAVIAYIVPYEALMLDDLMLNEQSLKDLITQAKDETEEVLKRYAKNNPDKVKVATNKK